VRRTELTVYCIDTSSLVNLRLWWSRTRNQLVWQRVDDLIRQDRLIAPKQVLEELHDRDDTLLRWARSRKRMFKRSSQELVELVQEVVRKFPDLVDADQPTKDADPFVVALAIRESRQVFQQNVYVVTEEKYAPGRTRIPHVCQAYGLKYLTIHQLFVFEDWSF